MAIINCPECGKEISDKAKSCPHCGYPISDTNNITAKDETKRKTGKTLIIIGILCWIGIIFLALASADKALADRTNYLVTGNHIYPEVFLINIIQTIGEWLGFILIIIGIVVCIVHRKKN